MKLEKSEEGNSGHDVGKEGCSTSHVRYIAFLLWVVWKLGLITCVKCEVGKKGMPSNLYDESHLDLHDLWKCPTFVLHNLWHGLCLVVSYECYLVDPGSSHMLVSKIKPCMCKYELY